MGEPAQASEPTAPQKRDTGSTPMADLRSSPLGSTAIVGLLADRDRRLVLAGLLLGATEPGDIAAQVGLGVREVVKALDRMVAVGLVEQLSLPGEPDLFHLLEEAFQMAARDDAAASVDSSLGDKSDEFADFPAQQRQVLSRSLQDGKLVALPKKHSKRLIVLDYLAQRFEPGVHYTERQVNAMLVSVDTDVATLRRWLVDTGMLDRADGTYWRSGATFEISER